MLFIQHAASDYYKLDDLLTHEEKNLRNKIRELVVEEVAPIMTEVNIHINTCMQHSLTNLPLQVKKKIFDKIAKHNVLRNSSPLLRNPGTLCYKKKCIDTYASSNVRISIGL